MPSAPDRFRAWCREIHAHKAWVLTPMLIALIFFILAVAHLLRHEKAEFLYSLF
jgi:hypothetical protein